MRTLDSVTGSSQIQAVRRGQGKPDLLAISAATEQWLRQGYEVRMNTDAVRRDLGPILAHGEPETGMGQGEAAEGSQPPADTSTAEPPAAAATAVAALPLTGRASVDLAGYLLPRLLAVATAAATGLRARTHIARETP